jgi:hypothetical protein
MTHRLLLPISLAGLLCVDVKIDKTAYLNCLNEMFREAARPAQLNPRPNPTAAPGPAVGTYNQAATREMLGNSFGHSVIPERPAPSSSARPGALTPQLAR